MKKRILTATLLASAVMACNINAYAVKPQYMGVPLWGKLKDPNGAAIINYSPNQIVYTSGGYCKDTGCLVQQTGIALKNIPELFDFIARDVFYDIAIKVDPKDIAPLLKDIGDNKDGSADIIYNELVKLEPNLTKEEFTKELKTFSTLDRKQSETKIQKLFGKILPTLSLKEKKYIPLEKQKSDYYKLSGKLRDKRDNIFKQSQMNKGPLSEMLKEKAALKKSKKPADKKKLEELKLKINSSKEIVALRNDPESQEALKKGVEFIQSAKDSKDDKLIKVADSLLKAIENDRDFIFADPTKVSNDELPKVQKSDTHGTSAILNSSLTNAHVLNDRINGFTNFSNVGISSGDAFQTYGAWVKGSFGVAKQKAFKAETGYSSNQKGLTIGVDTGDESLIGLAYSFMQNDVKSKSNSSASDKTNTHILSVYGLFVSSSEMFVSGQASYGASFIDKKRSTGDLQNNVAQAKVKGSLAGGRAEIGYVYQINEAMSLVPTVGVAYNSVTVNSYSEKGKGLNRKIAARTSSRTSGLTGIALKNVFQDKFVAEIHANADYAFSAKNPDTIITLVDGLAPVVTPSEKISELYYSIGGSASVKASNAIDISVGYDLGLSKKFISNTGTLKVKVNF